MNHVKIRTLTPFSPMDVPWVNSTASATAVGQYSSKQMDHLGGGSTLEVQFRAALNFRAPGGDPLTFGALSQSIIGLAGGLGWVATAAWNDFVNQNPGEEAYAGISFTVECNKNRPVIKIHGKDVKSGVNWIKSEINSPGVSSPYGL